jgi:hypothetical protein
MMNVMTRFLWWLLPGTVWLWIVTVLLFLFAVVLRTHYNAEVKRILREAITEARRSKAARSISTPGGIKD